jgi:UDP-N-acetylglucosamine 4,6-dehydratase
VADEFEYRSDTNPHFLTVEQIAALHADIKP